MTKIHSRLLSINVPPLLPTKDAVEMESHPAEIVVRGLTVQVQQSTGQEKRQGNGLQNAVDSTLLVDLEDTISSIADNNLFECMTILFDGSMVIAMDFWLEFLPTSALTMLELCLSNALVWIFTSTRSLGGSNYMYANASKLKIQVKLLKSSFMVSTALCQEGLRIESTNSLRQFKWKEVDSWNRAILNGADVSRST